MFTLARMLSLAAASALVALTAVSISACAEELPQNLGPVGPHEPILTTVGNKRVLASSSQTVATVRSRRLSGTQQTSTLTPRRAFVPT